MFFMKLPLKTHTPACCVVTLETLGNKMGGFHVEKLGNKNFQLLIDPVSKQCLHKW